MVLDLQMILPRLLQMTFLHTMCYVEDFLVKHSQKQVKDLALRMRQRVRFSLIFAVFLNTISQSMLSLRMYATLQAMITEILGE